MKVALLALFVPALAFAQTPAEYSVHAVALATTYSYCRIKYAEQNVDRCIGRAQWLMERVYDPQSLAKEIEDKCKTDVACMSPMLGELTKRIVRTYQAAHI